MNNRKNVRGWEKRDTWERKGGLESNFWRLQMKMTLGLEECNADATLYANWKSREVFPLRKNIDVTLIHDIQTRQVRLRERGNTKKEGQKEGVDWKGFEIVEGSCCWFRSRRTCPSSYEFGRYCWLLKFQFWR